MNFLIPIYQRKIQGSVMWVALGGIEESCEGRSPGKVRDRLTRALKREISELSAREAARLCAYRSMTLRRVALELTLKGAQRRQVSGKFPIIVEPRWANEEQQVLVCYHPLRPNEWFPCPHRDELKERATWYFREVWKQLSDVELDALKSDGRDVLKLISFDAQPKPLEHKLDEQGGGVWSDLEADRKKKQGELVPLTVLPKVGVDLTPRAIEGSLVTGRPRSPYRAQLRRLLAGDERRTAVLVGPPGCGKSTLIHQLVADLVEQDDYLSHLNLDRVHHVWRIAGKRLIAGMSHVGDWERRCGELLQELQGRKILLYVEDIAAFSRIGQSRDSQRSLADYFRGPIARGDVVMLAECTAEAWTQLQEQAPSFASLFVRLGVQATARDETYQLMFHEARALELKYGAAFAVTAYRTIVELTDSLYPGAAFPGKALGVLRALAKAGQEVGDEQVLAHLAARTGLPNDVLNPQGSVDPRSVRARFARRVMGQPEAVQAATDLSLRIREGLTDPSRPYSVMLFTGPTGTGKTELAKAIAEHQYGSLRRLVRLDMSEVSGPDGPSRLIGHRFNADGLLTLAVQEQPFCVVLLDEIEKAHPSVLNLLLQLFDEGRLTDAAGRVADFRRAIIIMTSNLGARQRAPVGFEQAGKGQAHDMARAVRAFFPPELFNRIDQVVPFASLDEDAARQVADKELAHLVARRGLLARNVYVATSKSLLDQVVLKGFDPEHGARTVKRYLEEQVATLLTRTSTEQRPAQMRALTVYACSGTFRVHEESLRECEPAPLRLSALSDEALDRDRLKALYGEWLDRFHSHVEQGGLTRLEQVLSAAFASSDAAGDLEVLEGLRAEVQSRSEAQSRASQDADLWDEYGDWDGKGALPAQMQVSARAAGAQGLDPDSASPPHLRAEIAHLARLCRALRSVGTARHAARIEVRHVGPVRASSDVGPIVRAYLGIDGVELGACASVLAGGRMVQSHGKLPWQDGERATHVVLDVVAVGIGDRLRLERGTHAYHTLAEGARLAVVSIGSESAPEPLQVLKAHLEARGQFERALEQGQSALPDNPDRLLPLIRRVHYRASSEPSVPGTFEVEDYQLQMRVCTRARDLTEAYQPLWQVVDSSEEL